MSDQPKISIAPDLKHYPNIHELLERINLYRKTHLLLYEKSEINQKLFMPNPDRFEEVKTSRGDKVLLPAQTNLPYLYRGEHGIYYTCKPSIYRMPSILEYKIFLERLRCCEFELLIKNHPVVKAIFLPRNYRVSYMGLAQHYGLKTDIIDITSSLDVALFFATCRYDQNEDCYFSVKEDGEHRATLHLMPFHMINRDGFEFKYLEKKVQVIGLQPFTRPGSQKGYSCQLDKDEDLNAFKYTFSYTKEDSEFYFNLFDGGKLLWGEDPLKVKTSIIVRQRKFSDESFNLCYNRHRINGISSANVKKQLKKMGIEISSKISVPNYSQAEKEEIKKLWNENDAEYFSQSITRRCFDELLGEKWVRHECMTFQAIGHNEMLRMIQSGFPKINDENAKDKATPNHERKVNIKPISESKKSILSRSKYMPATRIAAFWKTFLSIDECKI
jgi:hypothetical protein